jgi:tetratricopeptide (TPR) repeat protein
VAADEWADARRLLPETDLSAGEYRFQEARARAMAGQTERAIALLDPWVDGLDEWRRIPVLDLLGELLVQAKRFGEAEKRLRVARDLVARILGRDQVDAHPVTGRLAMALALQGSFEEAERHFRARLAELGSRNTPDRASTLQNIAGLEERTGRLAPAERTLRELLRLTEGLDAASRPVGLATAWCLLSKVLDKSGRAEEALAALRKAWESALTPLTARTDDRTTLTFQTKRLRAQGHTGEVDSILDDVRARLSRIEGDPAEARSLLDAIDLAVRGT